MRATAGERRALRGRVLIVGGGHVGLLLALALERLGLQPVVVDAQPVEATLGAPFGGRAIALMYGSKRVFEALDEPGAAHEVVHRRVVRVGIEHPVLLGRLASRRVERLRLLVDEEVIVEGDEVAILEHGENRGVGTNDPFLTV